MSADSAAEPRLTARIPACSVPEPLAVTMPSAMIDTVPDPSTTAWMPDPPPVTAALASTVRLAPRLPWAWIPWPAFIPSTAPVAVTATMPVPDPEAQIPWPLDVTDAAVIETSATSAALPWFAARIPASAVPEPLAVTTPATVTETAPPPRPWA